MSILSPITVAAVSALIAAWSVWWAIATGRLDRNRDTDGADDADEPTRVPERPALAGYVLSGSDGNICRVLTTTGPATVAQLVALRAVRVTAIDPDLGDVELGVVMDPTDLPTDGTGTIEREVLGHLRRCAHPAGADTVPTLSTRSLWHDPPSAGWWRRVRRSLASEAVAAGLARPTVAPALLSPTILVAAVVAAIGGLDLARALASLEFSTISPMWTVLGAAGARLAVDATRTALEPPHRLTRSGRLAATLLTHRYSDLARVHGPDDGLGTSGPTRDANSLAMATALGVTTRLTRQVPVPGHDAGLVPRARVLLSAVGGGVRPVQVVRPALPGRGGHPVVVLATGLGLFVAAMVLRQSVDTVSASSVLTRVRTSAPEAVEALDTVLDVAAVAALVPLIVGLFLAVAGAVDSVVTRSTVGEVIDVRFPDRHRSAERMSLAVAGIGGGGVPLVELSVDTGTGARVASWLVDERVAAPVGATVEVQRTPILGRVRSIQPVGGAGESPG